MNLRWRMCLYNVLIVMVAAHNGMCKEYYNFLNHFYLHILLIYNI